MIIHVLWYTVITVVNAAVDGAGGSDAGSMGQWERPQTATTLEQSGGTDADLGERVVASFPSGFPPHGASSFAFRRYRQADAPGFLLGGEGTLVLLSLHEGRIQIHGDGVCEDLRACRCGMYAGMGELEVLFPRGERVEVLVCSVPRISALLLRSLCALGAVVHEPRNDLIDTLFRLGCETLGQVDEPRVRLRDALGEALLQAFVAESGYTACMPQPVKKATTYFEVHFSEPCDLNSVASTIGVNKDHLVAAFRQHVGQTPMRYLWSLRTRKAVALIRSTQMTLSEIATATGYKSHFHLSREVKRLTGAAPRDIRRAAGAAALGTASPDF